MNAPLRLDALHPTPDADAARRARRPATASRTAARLAKPSKIDHWAKTLTVRRCTPCWLTVSLLTLVEFSKLAPALR